MSPAEISAVFSNVQSILPVNEGLLKALKKRQEDNPVIPHIGDVLLAHVDLLHVYTVYCSNQTMASVKVDELRTQYPLFASFVDVRVKSLRSFLRLSIAASAASSFSLHH